MPRSKFIKTLLAIEAIGLLAIIWGFGIEPGMLTHRIEKVKWAGPPTKIVFFSDLHAGAPHINESYIKNLVEKVNAERADLVLIGGDFAITFLLGGHRMNIDKVAAWLGQIHSRLGTFAVLGNHDWWNRPEQIQQALKAHGIEVLDNRSQPIEIDKFKFWLVGIADDFTHHSNPLLAMTQAQEPMILFMHDPGAMFDITQHFFLALAGHLHGGQIALPWYGALVATGRAPAAWANGWTQFKNGPLFVTRGLGTSILPVRLNAPPEYVVLELAP